MQQVDLNFEGGLTDQFPEFGDCLKASVYSCGRPLKAIAADLDMSASELSRKLAQNPNDLVHFPAQRLAELIAATGDLRPIYWLAEKFCQSQEARKKQAINELVRLMPALHNALKAAGAE